MNKLSEKVTSVQVSMHAPGLGISYFPGINFGCFWNLNTPLG